MTSPTRVSHYELLESIGRGGATEIFRARDTRLERDVAIKLLRPEEMARPGALERFRSEARTSSLVTHPHICAVHDSGEEGGRVFLVCEFLEGRALDDAMAGEPLATDRAIDIAIQIADALAAAHRRSVVHANLKPSNVFITTDGHVKLLELGAAWAPAEASRAVAAAASPASVTSTAAASIDPGTTTREVFHAYISPEQVTGAPADPRSDIFAAGALLYEMATGVGAFTGGTVAEIAANITGRVPPKPRSVNRALPRELEAVILRALEKAPGGRYQDGAALLEDLRHVRRVLDRPRPLSRWTTRRRMTAAAVAGGALLIVSGAGWWWFTRAPAVVQRSTILVSQIVNGTGEPEFDGTLREAIAVYLGQSPYLDLASDERINSVLRLMGRDPDTRMTHEIASEVCQRLGLHALIEGSVSTVGAETVVALAATDCQTGATIARRQVEVGRREEVLKALGQLTATLRPSLGETDATLARNNVPLEEATTPSLAALKAYTEAVAQRARGAELTAVKLLEQAIEIDKRFALAYTTLSSIYGGVGETGRSEKYAALAYEWRDKVSERERLIITYQYHDRVTGDQLQAREALEVWQRAYPRDYRAPNALAVLLNRFGDYAGAAAAAEEAQRRNPVHPFPRSSLAHAYRGAGRYADARVVAEEAVARGAATLPLRRLLFQVAVIEGNERLAQQQLDWAAGQHRGYDFTGARAQVAAYRGLAAQARGLYLETLEGATARGFPQVTSGYASQAALTDALYGYREPAIQQARGVVQSSTAFEPQLRAAAALALAGRPDEADALVRRLRPVRPSDTLLQNVYLPIAEAAISLARGVPAAAVEHLRRAEPYEQGTVAALIPMYLRGEALLRAGSPADALAEFQSVVDHRGADPFSPAIPLAYLGLARAQARIGKVEESRKSYAALFEIWKAGDADLPVLQAARAESTSPSPRQTPAPAAGR